MTCPHPDRVPAGDPRYDGFRLDSLYAYVVVDPVDDQEGFVPAEALIGWALNLAATGEIRLSSVPRLPPGAMLAGDMRRVEDLRVIVEAWARDMNVHVRVVRFDKAEIVEEYGPR